MRETLDTSGCFKGFFLEFVEELKANGCAKLFGNTKESFSTKLVLKVVSEDTDVLQAKTRQERSRLRREEPV